MKKEPDCCGNTEDWPTQLKPILQMFSCPCWRINGFSLQ